MGGSGKLAGTHPIGEDSIFYNAGFKSYDITRCKDKVGSWFEWVERSRLFIEASKVQGRIVKRWNMKDNFAAFYCTLKYNESGRYISFIALQGQNKSVIITPESTFKGDETQGITVKNSKQLHRSYKEALFHDRWVTEVTEKAEIQSTANRVRITGGKSQSEKDLLNRCLVGKFLCQTNENPNLNNVRRWACNSWKSAIEVKVYATNDGHFMFELPSRLAAEHVLTGQWTWKKMKLELEWWKPATGCWPAEVGRDWVWIKLLGLPMNLWSQKVFKEIGNLCGGYIETEEETSLKNHLHWARIKEQGDGEWIPREVEITCDDFTYTIPVWCEALVTVKFSEKRREEKGKYPAVNTQDQLLQITKEVIAAKKVDGHMGSSSEGSLMQVGPRFKRGEYNVYSRQKLGQRKRIKRRKIKLKVRLHHGIGTMGNWKLQDIWKTCLQKIRKNWARKNTNGGAEDVIQLGIQFPEEDYNTLSTSEWIQQNIIKLSSEFGVNFKGCEEREKELLMKIDSNKREMRQPEEYIDIDDVDDMDEYAEIMPPSKTPKISSSGVGQHGPGMKPPTFHEVRVTHLKKEVEKVEKLLMSIKCNGQSLDVPL
ncbi:hypothetical protein H5410_027787 [Solanum commersonii]|uniref:DUF4283 domain-containing protein n=1 Tax=Solanum commersonii TaxID=4109 RepID=A0A9J5Z326_SOLCO|nr:hypothetical protein H5410_027787 [Solanum commersonii]